MPTKMNDEMTHPGVKIGLQAGSSCCVNLEYLGFLECLLRAAAGSDAPSAAPAELDPPFGARKLLHSTGETKGKGHVALN